MRVLIFGGSGVISGYLSNIAVEKGYNVSCVCRGNKNNYIPRKVEILHADCNSEDDLNRVLKEEYFDVVVDFLSFYSKDIALKLNVLNGHIRQYIFISSACVYTSQNPWKKFVESDAKNNSWDYAIGKLACEDYLSSFCKNRMMTYTIVRPPLTYGVQRMPFQINSFLNSYSIVLRMKSGDPVLMAGDGNNYHTFTHAWDFCQVLTEMFLNVKAFGEDVHITSGISYTWNEVLDYISNEVKIKPKIICLSPAKIEESMLFKGSMTGDKARNMLYDNSKMQSLLKEPYLFSITLEEGIHNTYDFMRHHRQFQKIDRDWNEEINQLIGYRKKNQISVVRQLDVEKYYIELNGRYSRDFSYAFKNIIPIAGYVSIGKIKELNSYLGKPVYSLDELKNYDKGFYKIVICRSPDECQEEELEQYGIRYAEHWKYAEDMLELLDKNQLELYIKGRKIIVWGAGLSARNFLTMYPFITPEYLIDKDCKKYGTHLFGHVVCSLDRLKQENKEECYVVVAAPYTEVKCELEGMGWQEGRNFVDVSAFWTRPSEVMHKILYSPTRTVWQCKNPFEHVRIMNNGNFTYCYCADSSQMNMGRIPFLKFEEYQKSCLLRLIRLSMLNGTYVFCNKKYCSMLRKKLSEESIEKDYEYPLLESDKFKLVTDINIDESCNLYCASCRNQVIIDRSEWKQRLTESVIEQVLPETEILFMAGNGEVFASSYYKQILHARQYKKIIGIMILSNGNICKKDEWDYITNMVGGNVHVSFSVDAATEKTYCKLRRGGDFKKVEANIRYVCNLKRHGKVRCVALNFVMQRENYRELEDFVIWGKELGVDYFNITYLENWGTWTEEEFLEKCMYQTEKNPCRELQEEIKKTKKYGDCILLDDAYRYRQIAYSILKNF